MAVMTRGRSFAVALVAAGAVVAPAASAFAAETTCDAYSGQCTTVEGNKITKTPPTTVEANNSTLPFTGGEILLMSVAGGALVGGGIVLVSAGRRRRTAQAV
jgi:hypothetical protein